MIHWGKTQGDLSVQTVIFLDHSFPCDGVCPNDRELQDAWPEARICGAQELGEALADARVSCLVMLHGSYFPKASWPAILAFLRRGGGLVHVGGAPFKIPVDDAPEGFIHRGEETAYHQQLYIHEALHASADLVHSLAAHEDLPVGQGWERILPVRSTVGLILTPAQQPDHPHQMGSASTMDTRIYPLVRGLSEQGRHVTSPVVLLEHYRGRYAGGRWVLVNQTVDARLYDSAGVQLLKDVAAYCARGAIEMWMRPQYATYLPGERATLTYQWERMVRGEPALAAGASLPDSATWDIVVIVRHAQQEVWRAAATIKERCHLQTLDFLIPLAVVPGLYEVTCEAVSSAGEKRTLRQAYWGRDAQLLATGERLHASRDYFMRGDKPLPIVGMTYMTSDVGRKFLTLPNPHAWNQDMAELKAAGVNLLRTGLWTAWRHVMFEDGHASEAVLRAIDAFALTAKAHDLEVTFTFFAFTPEAWEGVNPYLDPRSVKAQQRFIAAIVSRYQDATHIHWDLINEPSLFDPSRPFSGPRSLGDHFERAAWVQWLKSRHPSLSQLQHHWNMTPEELPNYESASLPRHEDISFSVEDVGVLKRGTRWLDYTLFTMDMHNQWISHLSSVIRDIAPSQLITVGQDEALGLGPRPSPFFYASAVDYTTVHTWWLNDDLLWDGVFAKAIDKPSLVQETGIMYLETPDNRAKRSEDELASLLERKYAYAFATGGAGAVQWIWNTNYFMANVNESNIGALRADGSQKPEAQVSYDFGAFMKRAQAVFGERQLEEIAVVFPYSNDFSNRRLAFDATSRAVRILAYDMKTPVRGISEYHLATVLTGQLRPKLVIVPSAHNFSDEARLQLLRYVESGGTLLWSGPIALDAYWRTSREMEALLGAVVGKNVSREELLVIDGTTYPVSFGARRIAEVCKETLAESGSPFGAVELVRRNVGAGTLLWCPLPVELSEQSDVVIALYRHAVTKAGIQPWLRWCKGQDKRGVYGGKLPFDNGALYVFVSEHADAVDVCVQDGASGRTYTCTVEAQRSALFAVDQTGAVIASYRQVPIVVS